MLLKPGYQVLLSALLILVDGCIAQFIPEVGEDQNLLVVDGIITDQSGQNSVKLSLSSPLGGKSGTKTLSECSITVSDDFGNSFKFTETDAGTYIPDASFCGSVGRLTKKYSILVKQYSVSEEEYGYSEKLQNVIQHVGSLYDLTPASIPSNIGCIENPGEKVLGYFSVSAVNTKRIFINNYFRGIINLYSDCGHKAIGGNEVPPNLGVLVWIIIDRSDPSPRYKSLTFLKSCYDCTVRGTNIEPPFRDEGKI